MLNTYTSNDSYPKTWTSESISVIEGETHITVIDVKKVFHQTEVEAE